MFVGYHYIIHKIRIIFVAAFILAFFYSLNHFVFVNLFKYKVARIPYMKVSKWHRNETPEKYCVWFNFTIASFIPPKNSITLCTHGSIGYAKYVFDYAKNWNSSISVSLIIDETAFTSLAAYKSLFSCNSEMQNFVTTHIVWKETPKTPCDSKFIADNLVDLPLKSCDLKTYKMFAKHSLNHPYPPNTLRNIARFGALSNEHLIADIENRFSDNAAKLLENVAEKVTENDVIAIRRFEYDENEEAPANATILQKLMERDRAYVFHYLITKRSHAIENVEQFLAYSSDSSNPIKVDPIKYVGTTWEPQLLVLSSHPYHFEGAPIRYADQNMLPYELCRANINFHVVSHVFSFHKGIKQSNTLEELEARNRSLAIGETVTYRFQKYINKKYPNSEDQCQKWPVLFQVNGNFFGALKILLFNLFL